MSNPTYDVLVLGAGPAGQTVATAAAQAGKTVAITEGRAYGGTCPLRGCDPKLVLHAAAATRHRTSRLLGKGLTGDPAPDWSALMKWKRTFTEPIPDGARKSLQEAGVEIFDGYATFVDEHTVRFGDGPTVKAETIVIATGQKPRPLDFPGHEHAITSDDFLDLDELPTSLLIIGGGYIGAESAHIAHAMGTKVTVATADKNPLTGFDPDLVKLLQTADEERGMIFHLGFKAIAIRKIDTGYEVDIEAGEEASTMAGEVKTLTTDCVLHAAGRVPNIEELQLDVAGIEHGKKGIKVNERLRTNLAHVYAIGDCSDSGLALTPVATREAAILNANLFDGQDFKIDYSPVPTVAFTTPGIASVGLTAEEADDDKHQIKFGDAKDWFHARHLNAAVFGYKTIAEKSSGRILGAHLVGPEATEIINLFTLAIHRGMTTEEIRQMVWAYPTGASVIGSMLS